MQLTLYPTCKALSGMYWQKMHTSRKLVRAFGVLQQEMAQCTLCVFPGCGSPAAL